MLLVDRETMQKIDNFAINELKIPSLCLVERAAISVMDNINLDIRHTFAIVVSCGNNGADGLALARNLLSLGKKCYIYIVGNKNKASEDFIINYNACKNLTNEIYSIETIEDMDFLRENLDKVNTIIDGIFGTGLNRPVSGIYANIIDLINDALIFATLNLMLLFSETICPDNTISPIIGENPVARTAPNIPMLNLITNK